jgi:hypothetical protein
MIVLDKLIDDGLSNSFILIDTNFPIEFSKYKDDFKGLTEIFNNNNCSLFTIHEVFLEYIRGSNILQIFKKKKKLWNFLNIKTIVTDEEIKSNVEKIVEIYRSKGENLDITDFYLGATLMKYNNPKTFLLTSNVKHFNCNLFDISYVLPIEHKEKITTFYLYKFSDKKYQVALENYMK